MTIGGEMSILDIQLTKKKSMSMIDIADQHSQGKHPKHWTRENDHEESTKLIHLSKKKREMSLSANQSKKGMEELQCMSDLPPLCSKC